MPSLTRPPVSDPRYPQGVRARSEVSFKRARNSSAAGASIRLSALSIGEDAEIGDAVGTLSVSGGEGVYTFSITADPDSKFAIDGDALELADTLDFETDTSHGVTIEADNGVDDPISRVFTITVTDVFEAPPPGAAPTYHYLGF